MRWRLVVGVLEVGLVVGLMAALYVTANPIDRRSIASDSAAAQRVESVRAIRAVRAPVLAPTTLPVPTTTTTTTTTEPKTIRTIPSEPRLPLVETTALPGPEPVRIASLRIPKIKLSAPVYEDITQPVLAFGPGHWPGSSRPGRPGNVVIGGHRTTYTKPFPDIDRLRPGDQIKFSLGSGTEAVYVVTRTFVVPDTGVWIANQTVGSHVTLFACHPKGSASQRIVVRGTLTKVVKR